jgi:hypothetical protein
MDDVSKLLESVMVPGVEAASPSSALPIQALAWIAGSAPEQGSVIELSPRDVKIEFSRPLKLGSLVEIELSSSLYGFSVAVHGLIHWRAPMNNKWLAGAFLNQTLPENVIQHCWSDLRKELRYDCRWDCELLTARDRRGHAAALLNYSRSGAMIQSTQPAARGDEVLVVDPGSFEKPVLVRGIVRWVTQGEDGSALLGCELPDDQGSRLAAYLRTIGVYAEEDDSDREPPARGVVGSEPPT